MLSTLKTGLSTRGLTAIKAASIATRSYSAPTNRALPENMSLEDRLVYGEPVQIPTTHNITVAHLHLRSYLPNRLEFFADFARRTAAVLDMPCSGIIPLPVQTSKWTVNKSPFVHKKAQETFERKTHKRLLAIKDTHPEVVRRWIQFLNQNSMAGIGMKVTIWENEELGIGQKRLDKVKKGESRNRSVAELMRSSESGTDGQEPSKDVKAVADQLLAEMMKDIGGQEEILNDNQHSQDEPTTSITSPASPTSPTSTTTSQEAPSSPAPTSDNADVPTESHISDAIEPLVSASSNQDPELSKVNDKTVIDELTTDDATKSDKQ
ncbi:mitochondrial 37S ribosomal protein rsm10 [Mortierella claussenii]|nr:mitochondrial 37S ribosomal protein rsm10 [Mortierella claussenii]